MHVIQPSATLRPFVKQLWVSQSAGEPATTREHVLPTGEMHLVFRLAGPALRIYSDAGDHSGRTISEPVLGGIRTRFYVKETAQPVLSLGVQLLPGAALSLFGVSAAELAERHTPLSELWGSHANSALEQLSEAIGPRQQLTRMEALLAARLPVVHGIHPAVAQVLDNARHSCRIDEMVRDSRYSHRGFIALFRQATGCSPKRYVRLMRFQALLAALRDGPARSLCELALDTGFSDQSHMNREFREFAGVTPMRYRLLAPVNANHVAVGR